MYEILWDDVKQLINRSSFDSFTPAKLYWREQLEALNGQNSRKPGRSISWYDCSLFKMYGIWVWRKQRNYSDNWVKKIHQMKGKNDQSK